MASKRKPNVVPIGPNGGRKRRGTQRLAAEKRIAELEARVAELIEALDSATVDDADGLDRDALADAMRVTRDDIDILKTIVREGGRNCLARTKALEVMLAYAYGKPRQEIGFGGAPAVVKHVVEIVEANPDDESG